MLNEASPVDITRQMNRSASLRTCLLALVLVAISQAGGGTAAAAGSPFVTIRPQQYKQGSYQTVSYFKLRARGGATLRVGRVMIRNPGTQAVRVRVDPVDALTSYNLGSAYKAPGLSIHGSTRWTRLSARMVSIAPKGTSAVDLALSVPARAKGGQYLSGVSIEALGRPQDAKLRGTVAVASVNRYGVGVQVSLPGPRRPLIRFHGARVVYRPPGLTFLLNARNEGNVILQRVHGWARVSRQGSRILTQQIGPGTFVSRTRIEFPLLDKREHPPQGTIYCVKALMRYKGGVARLDQLVTFGKRQAQLQEQYGGPPYEHGNGLARWLLAALAVLLLGAAGGAVYLRQLRVDRRPLDRTLGLAMLERELGALALSDRSLEVTLISNITAKSRRRRKAVRKIQSLLGSGNAVCELDSGRLLVVQTLRSGDKFVELGEHLAALNGATPLNVGTTVTNEPMTLAEVLAKAAAQTDTSN